MYQRNGAFILSTVLLLSLAACGRGGPGGADASGEAATVRAHEVAAPAPQALGVGHVPQSGSGLNSAMGSGLGLTGNFPSGTVTHWLGAGPLEDRGAARSSGGADR